MTRLLIRLPRNGKFIITLFGAVANWKRDIISERTTVRLKSARRRGNTIGPQKRAWVKEGKAKSDSWLHHIIKRINYTVLTINEIVRIKSKPTLVISTWPFRVEGNCKRMWSCFLDEETGIGKGLLFENISKNMEPNIYIKNAKVILIVGLSLLIIVPLFDQILNRAIDFFPIQAKIGDTIGGNNRSDFWSYRVLHWVFFALKAQNDANNKNNTTTNY